MKLLSVFCVVICVQSAAFLHIQNNVPDMRYQNGEAIQLSNHRNTEIPLHSAYDDKFRGNRPIGRLSEQLKPMQNIQIESRRTPSEYINSQPIEHTNEQFLNEERHTGNQGHYFQDQAHPKYINPPVRRFIETHSDPKKGVSQSTFKENILPDVKRFNEAQHILDENISDSTLHFSSKHETVRHNVLPLKPVDLAPVVTVSTNINTPPVKSLNDAKLMPLEDTKLEMQGVSPDFITSLINEDKSELQAKPLTSPYEKVNNAEVKYLDNTQFHSKKHFEQDEITYENPSAEVLYSTQRALPYEIKGQQLPSTSQGGVNFYDNINSARRLEDIKKLMQPSKRYMIIHPDGRVEHIDEIEKIIKIHPNYVMIKSQDFFKHIEGKSDILGLKIPPLFGNNRHDAIVNPKYNQAPHQTPDIPSGHKSLSQFANNPSHAKDTISDLGKLLVSNEPNIHQTQIKTVKEYSQILPENNNQHDNNQLLSSSLLPQIDNYERNNYIKNEQSINQLKPIVKENEFKNSELTSLSLNDNKQIQSNNEQEVSAYDSSLMASSKIATITEKNNDDFNKTVQTNVSKTENTTSPFVNLTIEDNLPPSPHEHQIILNDYISEESESEESGKSSLNTLLVPKTSMPTPATIAENNIKNTNTMVPYQNNAGPLQNSTVTMLNTTVPNPTEILKINLETLQDINDESSDTLSATTQPEVGVISINKTAAIPSKTSLTSDDQEESINKNVTNIIETLNVTSPTTSLSNTENTTNKTGFWFQADEQFWHNIMSNNDTHNLFYFFFVPPKSNIMQKETKTTLYPNGTTVEEVIETIDEDGVPKVIRRTKVFLNSTSSEV